MTEHVAMLQPSHPGGCPCLGCEDEREQFARCVAVLVAVGEIPAEKADAL